MTCLQFYSSSQPHLIPPLPASCESMGRPPRLTRSARNFVANPIESPNLHRDIFLAALSLRQTGVQGCIVPKREKVVLDAGRSPAVRITRSGVTGESPGKN